MSLLDKIGARKEAAAFFAEVDAAVTPSIRDRIVKAAETLAWALTWRVLLKAGLPLGVVAAAVLAIGGSQATGVTPPGVADSGTTINVPASPGNTSALDVCKNGVVSKSTQGVHLEGSPNAFVDGYAAVLGPERLTYTDSPPGGKNLVVTLNGQPLTVQPEVVKCLLSRGK